MVETTLSLDDWKQAKYASKKIFNFFFATSVSFILNFPWQSKKLLSFEGLSSITSAASEGSEGSVCKTLCQTIGSVGIINYLF